MEKEGWEDQIVATFQAPKMGKSLMSWTWADKAQKFKTPCNYKVYKHKYRGKRKNPRNRTKKTSHTIAYRPVQIT